jgi:hypothetical protein
MNLCIIEPKDRLLLSQAGARVAKQVKEKLLTFFQPDAPTEQVSETTPTNSPSVASGETVSTT